MNAEIYRDYQTFVQATYELREAEKAHRRLPTAKNTEVLIAKRSRVDSLLTTNQGMIKPIELPGVQKKLL